MIRVFSIIFPMIERGNSTEKTKYSFEIEDRPIRSQERDHRENKSMRESIESIETTGENRKHPLDGVPGFEKLPTPEEIYRSHDRTLCSGSTTNSHTWSDSKQKLNQQLVKTQHDVYINWELSTPWRNRTWYSTTCTWWDRMNQYYSSLR